MTLRKTTHTTDDSDDIIILIGQSGAMFASLHTTAYELIRVKIRRLTSDLSMTILHQSLTSEVSRGSKWLPADLNQTIGGLGLGLGGGEREAGRGGQKVGLHCRLVQGRSYQYFSWRSRRPRRSSVRRVWCGGDRLLDSCRF